MRSHQTSLLGINIILLNDSVGTSTGVQVLILFSIVFGVKSSDLPGERILQILKYTLEGSGSIAELLIIKTWHFSALPLVGEGRGWSLFQILQVPFMSEVFYENTSAAWQHPVILCSFFSILLPVTYLSGA